MSQRLVGAPREVIALERGLFLLRKPKGCIYHENYSAHLDEEDHEDHHTYWDFGWQKGKTAAIVWEKIGFNACSEKSQTTRKSQVAQTTVNVNGQTTTVAAAKSTTINAGPTTTVRPGLW